jgi:Rrf2 family protein
MSGILRISEAAALGIHAFLAISGSAGKERLSTGELAKRLKASSHHLAKVMQRLVKAGFLHSTRGPGGGFELAIPPERVSLLALYRAVEGEFPSQACLFGLPICEGRRCPLDAMLSKVNREVREYFETTTINQLLGELEVNHGDSKQA